MTSELSGSDLSLSSSGSCPSRARTAGHLRTRRTGGAHVFAVLAPSVLTSVPTMHACALSPNRYGQHTLSQVWPMHIVSEQKAHINWFIKKFPQ